MTFTILPMPWKRLNEYHWQAVTSMGTWDISQDPNCENAWSAELRAPNGKSLIQSWDCKDAEDGKRIADAERRRILTGSLEPVEDGGLDRAKAAANERMLNDCTRIEDLEKALKDCRAMITGERRTNLINALRITIDEALARHKAGKGGGA